MATATSQGKHRHWECGVFCAYIVRQQAAGAGPRSVRRSTSFVDTGPAPRHLIKPAMPQLQQTTPLRSSRRQTAGASGLTATATSNPKHLSAIGRATAEASGYRTHCE